MLPKTVDAFSEVSTFSFPPRLSCSVDEAALEDQQSNQSHSSGPDTGAPPTQSHDERQDVPLQAVPADLDPEEDHTLLKVSRCSG